jgi:glyoxylase-like metal-dependent hydrolase (beta-lactamase superfamily II)
MTFSDLSQRFLTFAGDLYSISMKLTDSVYLVGGSAYGLSATGDCNVYLIDCGGESVLIDAGGGFGIKRILANVKEDGFDPRAIKTAILTHCHFDHIGGANELKELTGCRLVAHKGDSDSITNLDECVLVEMAKTRGIMFNAPKLDGVLENNDHLNVGEVHLGIIHTPGHTPGCISVSMTERDGKKAIFTGDIASTTGRLGFINGPGFDLAAWKMSLKRLIAECPDRIYPGHGTFMLNGAVEDLKLTDLKMNSPWTTIVTSVG